MELFQKGKESWSLSEDKLLIELVNKMGSKAWIAVAQFVPKRTAKQCRERWINQLDPKITRAKWTRKEDILLIELHAEYGSAWSKIAKQIPGRSDNMVKNRWNSSITRRLRQFGWNSTVISTENSAQVIESLFGKDSEQKRKPIKQEKIEHRNIPVSPSSFSLVSGSRNESEKTEKDVNTKLEIDFELLNRYFESINQLTPRISEMQVHHDRNVVQSSDPFLIDSSVFNELDEFCFKHLFQSLETK
eukprot:CAMPEP_0182445618 /NCGR_PEP_ID=MMETSP1172-20130603/3686_1 /TAXON_ID=708627 /ORGANISM="Timspurckia oligopyrenoides, Strain CCMP3278" /LENGTH=245 /DNA_ID=CAMNT_0024641423 /DNA_START=180 /DNA_END=917 /DNA_ORIENTATION=-